MQDKFRCWLRKNSPRTYAQTTIDAYTRSVDDICRIENCSWTTLGNDINHIVKIYDKGGEKEAKGNEGHRTVINALKRFHEFINDTNKSENPPEMPDNETGCHNAAVLYCHQTESSFVRIDTDILDWIHALGGDQEIWINQILRRQIKNASSHLK